MPSFQENKREMRSRPGHGQVPTHVDAVGDSEMADNLSLAPTT